MSAEAEAEAVSLDTFEGLDEPLRAQLGTFEVFFKTVGFKRVHGRVWGLLVLAGQPLSSKEVAAELAVSQGTTSTCLNELAEWGAVTCTVDSQRRCHLHAPVGNTLSIVATVLRRREQVVFAQFKTNATRTLEYVRQRYGERDPRALSLRSIVSSCEIAEAVIELVLSSVASALGDPQSLLSRAIHTAFRVGLQVPAKILGASGPQTLGLQAPEVSQATAHETTTTEGEQHHG
jgi:DNA-binding transcriptional regulator GbsR (MarR family)